MQPQASARFQPSETVDFAIVGSGAAGGIIAKELSTAGFKVVVLEQGPRLTEADFTHDEFGTFMRSRNSNSPDTQPQTFRRTADEKAQKGLPLVYGRLVGGSNATSRGTSGAFVRATSTKPAGWEACRALALPIGPSLTKSSSRITRKRNGNWASPASLVLSIHRARGRIRCRRYR